MPIGASSRVAAWGAAWVSRAPAAALVTLGGMVDETDWTQVFTEAFAAPPSSVEARIWREVYGLEFPAEVEPYSYVTRTELAHFVDSLSVRDGDLLIDIGCGRGGPGLWVAAATGASLLGVDISPTALADATARAERLGMADRAAFEEGGFSAIPAQDGSAHALMSVDALLFALDKVAAAAEMARVLRPGGRLVATTWDYHTQPVGRPPQVADHRPVLLGAGFDVIAYEETVNWESNQRRIDALVLENVDELAAESGEDPAEVRAAAVAMAATVDTMLRRVLIVAAKRT